MCMYAKDMRTYEVCRRLTSHACIAQYRSSTASCPPRPQPNIKASPDSNRPTVLRVLCRSERVYSHVFRMLNEYDVMIDAILLKPNMILPGLDAPVASPEDVAKFTVRTMMRSIPPAVPGIHFLSGGMSEEESTLNLQVCFHHELTASWLIWSSPLQWSLVPGHACVRSPVPFHI